MKRSLILAVVFLAASRLYAVEETSILHRYFVVGVISAGEKKTKTSDQVNSGAIAVIKDKTNQRSLLLKAGDQMPNNDHWRVLSIDRNHVFLTNDREKVELLQFVEEETPKKSLADAISPQQVDRDASEEADFDKYYSFRKNSNSGKVEAATKPHTTAALDNVIQFKPPQAAEQGKSLDDVDAADELGLRPKKQIESDEDLTNGSPSGVNADNYENNSFNNENDNSSTGYSEYWHYDESEDDFYFE